MLGLSGGIDSSVVTFLAARALGPENVLAVTMPYTTSSEATRRDSQAVIEQLGVQTIDVPISPQIDAYFAQLPRGLANAAGQQVRPRADDRSSTIRARPSGGWWRARATRANCCWATARSSATWPRPSIRSATSTRRSFTRWPPTWACRAPFCEKTPTGDLWVGQTDEGELGFSYAEVDRLLVLLVDRRWRRAELIEAGFAAEFVDRVADDGPPQSLQAPHAGDRQALLPHRWTATSATPATGERKQRGRWSVGDCRRSRDILPPPRIRGVQQRVALAPQGPSLRNRVVKLHDGRVLVRLPHA